MYSTCVNKMCKTKQKRIKPQSKQLTDLMFINIFPISIHVFLFISHNNPLVYNISTEPVDILQYTDSDRSMISPQHQFGKNIYFSIGVFPGYFDVTLSDKIYSIWSKQPDRRI